MLKRWEELPDFMRIPEVRPYWEVLWKRRWQILVKRVFDFILAILLLVLLFLPMVVIAVAIKIDSEGPVFYRQERATYYGKHFRIHKFRTMVVNADMVGTAVTVSEDSRITKLGSKLRRVRADELPQLFDVIQWNMSFVGTRPEAVKYVDKYEPEWNATLLLPAGITSECSIKFKDEDKLMDGTEDVDRTYMEKVLPEKMKWNLMAVHRFNIMTDLSTMIRTIITVIGRDNCE